MRKGSRSRSPDDSRRRDGTAKPWTHDLYEEIAGTDRCAHPIKISHPSNQYVCPHLLLCVGALAILPGTWKVDVYCCLGGGGDVLFLLGPVLMPSSEKMWCGALW